MGVRVSGPPAYNAGPIAATAVASGGRTFTFAAGPGTLTASSGSFVTDGFVVGMPIYFTGGAGANDSDALGTYGFVTNVAATVLTGSFVFADEGPLSAGTLEGGSPFRFLIGAELQDGRFGHYVQVTGSDTGGVDVVVTFEGGRGLRPGFNGWGPEGIKLATKVLKDDLWVSAALDFTLELLSPADGTTVLAMATRSVTADDSDYEDLSITQATLDALSLQAGDEVRLKLTIEETGNAAGSGGIRHPYTRLGRLLIDDGALGGGGPGGGGGGGSGDLTEVTGTSPIVVTSGTGPVPNVTLPGAALTTADDTNVTATLGGSHATALARAASITLGWTGQLAVARGGTGTPTANANTGFMGPTTGAAAAPSFRALVADDIPALPYVPAANQSANVVMAGPASGAAAAPAFRALVPADMPTGTDDSSFQVGTSGVKLTNNAGALEVRDNAGALSVGRGADPVGATDFVTKGVLDATEITLGLGLNVVDYQATGDSNTRTSAIADDGSLDLGSTGLELTVTGRNGASSGTLKVQFDGVDILYDENGSFYTLPGDEEFVLQLTLMQRPSAPGTFTVWHTILGSGGTYMDGCSQAPASDVSMPTLPADLVSVLSASDGRIHNQVVKLIGGIPPNPVTTDAETPRAPQASAAGLPTAMIVKSRTGTGPTLHRATAGISLSGTIDVDISSDLETGSANGPSYMRANGWVEYRGQEYIVLTVSTTAHVVYRRPLGGGSFTLVHTHTVTCTPFTRTGLHVVVTPDGTDYLCYVGGSTTVPSLIRFDGTTWTVTAGAAHGSAAAIGAYGVCVVNGVMYVPLCPGANTTIPGYAVTVATPAFTQIPVIGTVIPKGAFASIYGRVFYMTGSSSDARQRTLYEYVGGLLVALLTLTSAGTDTSTNTQGGSPGCLVPIAENKLLAFFATNNGGAAAAAFWKAVTITFTDGASDYTPTETDASTIVPAVLAAAGGAASGTYGIFPVVDAESDPGNEQIHFWVVAQGGTYALAKFEDVSTIMVPVSAGMTFTNHAVPAGDTAGGHRFSPSDSNGLVWDTITWAPATATGNETLTFKFQRGGSDKFTVKLFYSVYGSTVAMAQATLTGTASGGTATRSGNEVQNCEANTSTSIEVDWSAMGVGSEAAITCMLKAYRE